MENWNNKAFSDAVKKAAQKNTFELPQKTPQKYKTTNFTNEDIYQYLSKKINYDAETIKKWGNHNSSGPQNEETAVELEKLLKVQLYKRKYSNQYEQPYKAAVSSLYTLLSAFWETLEENNDLSRINENELYHFSDYLFFEMRKKRGELPEKYTQKFVALP